MPCILPGNGPSRHPVLRGHDRPPDDPAAARVALAAAAGIHQRCGNGVMVCLPTAMGEEDTATTGTLMRPDTFRGYALAPGFEDVEVLGIEHRFFRFYRLR
jgi:hypothetical protein